MIHNVVNKGSVHVETFGDGGLSPSAREEQPSNFPNRPIIQLCVSMRGPFSLPHLRIAILQILKLCSKKKMAWINTTGIIAAMQDAFRIVKHPIKYLVAKSVCRNGLISNGELAMAEVVQLGTGPVPTIFSLINLTEESCNVARGFIHGLIPTANPFMEQ